MIKSKEKGTKILILIPPQRSLHDVTYNPITNKHMKSYKIGRDRKTTGE